MLAEAIKHIEETAREALGCEIVDVSDNPRMTWVRIGCGLTKIETPPPPRRHEVHTLNDIIRYAQAAAGGDSEESARTVVWHDNQDVWLVLDDEERHDFVRMHLTLSTPYAKLERLNAAYATEVTWMDQATFVQLLRCDLGAPPATVSQFRRLKWSTTHGTQGEVAHGADRMGKELQAQVSGADGLPEDITLAVPVYNQQGERSTYQVPCHVLTDTVQNQLALLPHVGATTAALQAAQASIRERLTAALGDTPVYYGNPQLQGR